MKHWLFIAFSTFFLLAIYACQEDEEILYDEPGIRMMLYNQSRLVEVEGEIALLDISLKEIDDSLTYYSDQADILLDSIIELEALIIRDGRDDLIPVKEEAEALQKEVLENYGQWEVKDSIVSAEKAIFNIEANTIESGNMLIKSMTNKKNEQRIEYNDDDSATVWRLPLSNTENDVSLTLEIGEASYDVAITYDLVTTVNEYNNVVMQAYNIDTLSHGFDSLKIKCATPECIDYETTLDIYF